MLASRALTEENRRLRSIAQVAELYTQRIDELQSEIEDLQKLQNLPGTVGRIKIPARVIGYSPTENRATISAGANQQVRPDLPVVTSDGLLGVVQTVDANSSQILLLTSPPPFKIGAKVSRDPPSNGLLHGDGPDRLSVEFTDTNAPMEVGDWVVTSGLSEVIPGGIPIGKIVLVRKDEDFGTRIAQVFPAAQIGRTSEVIVLR